METQLISRVAHAAALLLLLCGTSCEGVGLSEFNARSPLESTKEEEEEDTWWARLYGRKSLPRESVEWKDFYRMPNGQPVPRAEHCGFWGNTCTFDGAADKKGWW